MNERPAPASVPDAPGVYIFRDEHGRALYVGKAKSLRKRTANYFGSDLHPRTRAMVTLADDLEWIITESEVAALMLDWIERMHPEPRLIPTTPVRRICARVLEDWIDLWLPIWPRRSWATLRSHPAPGES